MRIMSMKDALNGSAADRDLWKWQQMENAKYMADVYKDDPEVRDGWLREAERYRIMLAPKDNPGAGK